MKMRETPPRALSRPYCPRLRGIASCADDGVHRRGRGSPAVARSSGAAGQSGDGGPQSGGLAELCGGGRRKSRTAQRCARQQSGARSRHSCAVDRTAPQLCGKLHRRAVRGDRTAPPQSAGPARLCGGAVRRFGTALRPRPVGVTRRVGGPDLPMLKYSLNHSSWSTFFRPIRSSKGLVL